MWKLLSFIFTFLSIHSYSQSEVNRSFLETMDSLFIAGEREMLYPGLSCSYVSNDTSWIGTYGTREWNTDQSINPHTKFQLGSVGKVLTALAVLQQVDEGLLDLNQDVQTYLDFPLKLYDSPITLRHLLTHSAGMNDRNIGYLSKDESHQESLEEHLLRQLPSFYQNAGVEISYSNYSYALAGLIVEKVSGIPFQEYVASNILGKLEMNDSYVGFNHAYKDDLHYAKGHTKLDQGFEVSEEFARDALPAGSFVSTANDMSKFLRAVINRDTSILKKKSWELLFERSFSNHLLLPGYSLGLEEQPAGESTYWAKGGMLHGFLSQVVFLPNNSVLFIAQNTASDDFLEAFHDQLRGKLFASSVPDSLNVVPTNLEKYAGEYRDARYDREGVENIISLFRGAFTVWSGKESLNVWHNGQLHSYLHQGNHVFVNSSNSDEKMVFVMDENNSVSKLYRSVNIGGVYVPTTYEKTSWYNSPTFVNEYYGVILIVIVTYGLISLFMMIVFLVRRWKSKFWKWSTFPIVNHLVALIGIGVVLIHIVKAILMLVKQTKEFLFGLLDAFIVYNNVAWAIPIFAILLWVLLLKSFTRKEGTLMARIFFSLFTLAFTAHAVALNYWNFI